MSKSLFILTELVINNTPLPGFRVIGAVDTEAEALIRTQGDRLAFVELEEISKGVWVRKAAKDRV